jgi:hypothetical protein
VPGPPLVTANWAGRANTAEASFVESSWGVPPFTAIVNVILPVGGVVEPVAVNVSWTKKPLLATGLAGLRLSDKAVAMPATEIVAVPDDPV